MFAVLSFFPLAAHADEAPVAKMTLVRTTLVRTTIARELRRYGTDSVSMLRAPLRWDDRQWRRAAFGLGAIATTAIGDEQIADFAQRNRSAFSDDFSSVATPFGGRRALVLSGAMIVGGLITHDTALRDTGRDALEASILAAGVVTPLLKRAVGRTRPLIGNGAYEFDPFSKNQSFPSGHATNAFAVASVVAGHSRGWVVPTIAYTIASGVAVSRVNDDVHFASDVIAGALIGTSIGRAVVARHSGVPQPNTQHVEVDLRPLPGGMAIEVRTSLRTFRRGAITLYRIAKGS